MSEAPYAADTRAKGWRFEIDMEKVKASDTWLRARSGALKGALLLLWSEAWQQTPCGSLPDDDELVALLIDMPPATLAKHRSVLMRGWSRADDGRLYHDTITKRVLAMLEKRAKDAARTAGRRGRTPESDESPPGVTRDIPVTPVRPDREFDTKHQAPSTKQKDETPPSGERGKPRASRKVPDGFALTAELRRWAAESAPSVDVEGETAKFRDHTFATTCIDWPGRWRNWMRKATPQARPTTTFHERDKAAKRAEGDRWIGNALKPDNVIDMEPPNAPRLASR